MTSRETFKRAFLATLEERGITKEAFVACMHKQSVDMGGTAAKFIVAPALLAPFMAGWQTAKTRRTSPADIRAIRDIELLKTYAQGIEDIDRSAVPSKKKKKKEKEKEAAAQPAIASGDIRSRIAAVAERLKNTPAAAPAPATGAPTTPTAAPVSGAPAVPQTTPAQGAPNVV